TAGGTLRSDRTDIDRQRRRRSLGKFQRERAANDIRRKEGRELAVFSRLRKYLVPRRLREARRIEARRREAPFVLVMRVQRTAGACERWSFHPLQPACAVAPHAERNSGVLESEVRCVEVRACHPRRARSAPSHGENRRVPRKIGCPPEPYAIH